MALVYKVGDKVVHPSREELGLGVVTAVYPNQACDVSFGDQKFSGLPISTFKCGKKIAEDLIREEVFELVRKKDFDGAREYHATNGGGDLWPGFDSYLSQEVAAHTAEVERLDRKRKEKKEKSRRKAGVLKQQAVKINHYLDTCFFEAEDLSRSFDDEWNCDFNAHKVKWMKRFIAHSEPRAQLSNEQLVAVGDVSHNCLLRARAGSGKTTVIKYKADFMMRHLGIMPEDIMVLAFNKGAANKVKKDLQHDFNHLTFENSRTFHSLAYQIVLPTEDLLFDIDSGSNAKQSKFVEALLKQELNPAVQKDIYKFFRREMREIKNLGSLLNDKDYYSVRRNSTQDTLKADPVKSIGEKWIADFLFEHGISYVYERSWYRDVTGEKGSYYPDFSLAVAGEKPDVVIEHWGIDEFSDHKTVPDHWGKTWHQYHNEMLEKRNYWREWNEKNPARQVVFIETSIRDMAHGRENFEFVLKNLLASINVHVDKRPEGELIERVVKKRVPRLAAMVLQFISKAKKRCIQPGTLEQQLINFKFSCEKERIFCQLSSRLYRRYQQETVRQNKIDYDDLMKRSVEVINDKRGNVPVSLTRDISINLNNLKWLMIDEYQDFSELFFNLIQALRRFNPAVRLFCVGDNWQAINSFAGSDLCYFDKFSDYFPGASLLDLCNNYRSQPVVVEQGNRFMAYADGSRSIAKADRKPQSLEKYLVNRVFIEQRSWVLPPDNPDYRFLSFIQRNGETKNIDVGATMARQFKLCYQLMRRHSLTDTSFMILNRSNYLSYGYENLGKFKNKLKKCFLPEEIASFKNFDEQVQCMTAHKSKGAEADVVILLNVKERKFPNVHPDSQLYTVLGDTQEDIYKEEERLFYVAITRAKQSLYIITEKDQESEFLERIDAPEFKMP